MSNKIWVLLISSGILIPILVYFLKYIFKEFDVKNLPKIMKFKLILFIFALFSDNFLAFWLVNNKNNFETLYYYSHFVGFFLMAISSMIPYGDLNIWEEFLFLLLKLQQKCNFNIFGGRKGKIFHEMVPLNLNENQNDPKESFENISLGLSTREDRLENNDFEKDEDHENNQRNKQKLLLSTFVLMMIIFCFLFLNYDVFAKLKRALSLMDTPKLFDFFNYPCFAIFLYLNIKKANKGVVVHKKQISQSNFLLIIK